MGKLIFFDVDGTIWDNRMQIPESTKQAIRELKANGHKTFICSGRGKGNIRDPRLLSLGFDGILAACGNHIEMGGEILYENLLDQELVDRIVPVIHEAGLAPVIYEGPVYHWMDMERGLDPFVKYLQNSMGEYLQPLQGNEHTMSINKLSAGVGPDADYEMVQRELGNDMDFILHPGSARIVEIIPKGSSKGDGIRRLCTILGTDISDTYGIGDSTNDIDMIREVQHGICMGNGQDSLKEIAEFVTLPLEEDGIYHAMKHYGLI